MRITVLGCAGTFPGPTSPCSGYLLEADGFRMLMDAGNGAIGNLQRYCGLLDVDAVLVSHLHGDHYLDLVTYTYARRYHPDGPAAVLPVYGPEDLAEHVLGAFSRPVGELLAEVYDFRGYGGGDVRIGPFRVNVGLVNHPVETFAMRISDGAGGTLAYSADTGVCPDLVKLVAGADVFVCEATYLHGEDNPPNIHLTGREAGEHAEQAGVGRLILTHLAPWGDDDRTLAEASDTYRGAAELAHPGLVVEL
jgi:ribonuclease BN (tRNA processing enzyme)